MSLEGKCALITGSTQGLGLAAAEQFAAAGCHVVLNGFASPEAVAAIRARLEDRSSRADAVRGRRPSRAGGDHQDDDRRRRYVRRRRHPGQQRRRQTHGRGRGGSGGAMGRGDRRESVGGVSHHPPRRPGHEAAKLGTHHQCVVHLWTARGGQPGGLRHDEDRPHRLDAGRRARDGWTRRHVQCRVPRNGANAGARGQSESDHGASRGCRRPKRSARCSPASSQPAG